MDKKPKRVAIKVETFKGLDIYVEEQARELTPPESPSPAPQEVKLADKVTPEEMGAITKLKL